MTRESRMIAVNMYSGSAGIIRSKIIVACIMLLALPVAHAQEQDFKFELTPFAGLTTGGDFEDASSATKLSLDDSSSLGLILNIRESANTQWEILYSRQATEADTTGLPISSSMLDLDVHYVHGGGTYLFDGETARPFMSATLGASHFAPGLSGIDSETFFSFSIGAGLHIRPDERFGIRLEARGYGTLLGSSSSLFCESGPSGAICAITVDGTVLWQFQGFAGFVFRF